MSDIGSMVAELIASGADPVVAARVVASAFAAGVAMAIPRTSADIPRNSADESADRRREKDRLRKQEIRRCPQMSADSPQISADVQNASLSKEERIESKEVSKRETTRGSRLPIGWTPTPQDWAVACELLPETRAKSELEKFTDHWKQQPGSRGVKLDWNAAWRNWTRRAAEYGAQRNGRRTVHDAAKDLHETLVARANIFDEPVPQSLRGGEGADVVRLLPPGRRE